MAAVRSASEFMSIDFCSEIAIGVFDVDQALLDEGARLIGSEMEKKAPNLRVISASTVRWKLPKRSRPFWSRSRS